MKCTGKPIRLITLQGFLVSISSTRIFNSFFFYISHWNYNRQCQGDQALPSERKSSLFLPYLISQQVLLKTRQKNAF